MATSSCPCASRVCRIAPTRPSIMSLGATMSAPASAWLRAARAIASSDRSLSTCPSRRMPQCPCEVYSHKHTSVIPTMSGTSSLIAAIASWTSPRGSQLELPNSSLCSVTPNRSTAGTPTSNARAARMATTSADIREWPGIASMGSSRPSPAIANIGRISWSTDSRCSRTMRRTVAVRRSRRGRTAGNPAWLSWDLGVIVIPSVSPTAQNRSAGRPGVKITIDAQRSAPSPAGAHVNDARSRPPAAPTPQELLNAYAFGAFPMDAPEYADERVPYYEADPRAVIPVGEFRTPRSVARGIARAVFDIRVNTAFAAVCRACSARPEGTWLSPRLVDAYCRLHAAGYAHSVEAWERQRLVGGLFGVALGGLFTSESMFHTASDAGNAVLVATAR